MTPTHQIDLELTTPHMHGPEVTEAQHLLVHNRYDHGFDPGQVDGEYGRHTAAATRRAKFYLGYPKRRCTARFGPRLYAYLVPKTSKFFQRRPPTYYVRSIRRIRAEKRREQAAFRQQAVLLALSKRGTHEDPPGSNNVIFNTWYYGHPVYGSTTYPWCAVFVSWVFSHVGRPLRYASVSEIYYEAAHRRNGLELVGTPERGDLALLDHLGHVGIFIRVIGASFEYVSGNTGSTSEADGGTVDVHTLPRSIVNAWVRVNRR
jgi:hypothetical protein